MSVDELKRAAAYCAADMVRDGMVVGLGSGSTARHATRRLAERLRQKGLRNIVGIPTSDETERLALEQGIALTTLDRHPDIDMTIDGADEVDPALNVIKGLGGFLLREKIVAAATLQQIIVVDESKLSPRLGTRVPVPVEVIPFGWQRTMAMIRDMGSTPALRRVRGQPYVTDEGNYILDCAFPIIEDPAHLALSLNAVPGVVENGLFVGLVDMVVCASPTGVRVLAASAASVPQDAAVTR